MLKKILSLIGAAGLSGALSLLASIIPSWWLTPEEYGYYGQFYVSASIAVLLLGLGLSVSFTYYVGQGRLSRARLSMILTAVDGLGGLVVVLAAAAIWILSPKGVYLAALLGLIVAAFFVRAVNLSSVYLGVQKIGMYNLLLLFKPGSMALAVGAWVLLSRSLDALYISIVLCSLLSYLCAYIFTGRFHDVAARGNEEVGLRTFVGYGLVGLISNLAYIVGQKGFVYILGASVSVAQSGLFFMFMTLLEIMLLVPSGIGLYFFSRASAGLVKMRDVRRCIIYAVAAFILMNLLFFSAQYLGRRVQGIPAIYLELLSLLWLSLPLQVCMLLLKILSQLACGYGLVRLTMVGSIAGGIVSVGAGYFVVGVYGIAGAIGALFAGNLVNLFIVFRGSYPHLRVAEGPY